MARYGIVANEDNVLITTGSQQALDLIGKILLDPGDVVLCEAPSYLGALQAFRAYQARFATVPIDDDGMRVEEIELILKSREIKLIYALPNFQNPAGTTISLERRKKLVALANAYGVPLVEAGKIVPLAVASKARNPRLPSVPTLDETLIPGFEVLPWVGLFGPPNLLWRPDEGQGRSRAQGAPDRPRQDVSGPVHPHVHAAHGDRGRQRESRHPERSPRRARHQRQGEEVRGVEAGEGAHVARRSEPAERPRGQREAGPRAREERAEHLGAHEVARRHRRPQGEHEREALPRLPPAVERDGEGDGEADGDSERPLGEHDRGDVGERAQARVHRVEDGRVERGVVIDGQARSA